MSHMTIAERTPQLKGIKGKTGLFVFDGLQRNSVEERKMLAEIIKEHEENNHFPKLPVPVVGKK